MFLLVVYSSRSHKLSDFNWCARDKYPGFLVLRFEFVDSFECKCPLIPREVLAKSPGMELRFVLRNAEMKVVNLNM